MNKKLTSFFIFTLVVSMFISTVEFPPVVSAEENSWSTMEPMPTARSGLGVAVVNGKIYAIGGLNADSQLAVNEEYNPVTNTWTTKTSMPTARSGFAVAVYQNKIYCIGGTTGDSGNIVSGFTGVTEVYDPATDTWETKTPMPTPRADLCAGVVNGILYCIGGKKYWGVDSEYQELNVTEAYDPAKNSWATKSPMPIPVLGAASAVLDGKIFVIGGLRNFHVGLWDLAAVGSNQLYDPEDDAWSTRSGLPTAGGYGAAEATSGVTAPKKIYVVGGSNQTNYSETTYAYDLSGNFWSPVSSMPTSRVYLAAAVVDDILYAIGGFDGERWLSINERYVTVGYGTVPPELLVLSPENKTYTSSTIQLVIFVNRPTTWIGYSLDNQETVTVTGDTELFDLPEGDHNIIVYVNDTFGNMVSSSNVSFSVDTAAPRILILSPENRTYGERDIQSAFTVDEPVSWMGYSLDGQDNVTVTGNVTLAVLSEGSHRVTFYATDLVGNIGASKTVYFEIVPFPTIMVAAVAVTLTIVSATGYLLLKRRKRTSQDKIA